MSIARGKHKSFSDHTNRDMEQVDSFALVVGLEQRDVMFFSAWFANRDEETYGLYEGFAVIFYFF